MGAGTSPDFNSPPGARKPLQFRLWELLLFMAAASGFMFLSAPLARATISPILAECMGLVFFALLWWKIRTWKWVKAGVLFGILFVLTGLLLPAVTSHPRPYPRFECANHLKQIGVALHTYHDAYGSFPPAFVADENGKPMHSWRVLLLPFLDEELIYQTIRLFGVVGRAEQYPARADDQSPLWMSMRHEFRPYFANQLCRRDGERHDVAA